MMRRRGRTICLALLLVCVLPACSAGSATTITKAPTRSAAASAVTRAGATRAFPNAAQLDAYLRHLSATGSLSGAVLVMQQGMLFTKGYNLADKEKRVPNIPQTRFRIGSVTKQFTAMAILMLQDRSRLRVEDHICRYIPNCPQDWQPITIEELLTHTSGIPNYTDFPDFAVTWTQPTTPEQLIARFKDMPLDFTPGSRFRYSNSGYIVLGYIIERVSSETYARFLEEHIFGPLKMRNTGYDSKYPALPVHATGYYQGYVKPDAYDPSVLYAAGALYSTVEDLSIWDQALLAHKLVSQSALEAMFTPHIPCPPPGRGGCDLGTDLGYGYGWFIGAEPLGRLIYHVGHIDGYFAYNGFYPQRGLIVVVLSNLETTNVLQIGRTLAAMVSGKSR